DLALDEFSGERRQLIVAAARPTIHDGEVAAFDKSRLLEALPECIEVRRERFGRGAAEKSDQRQRRLRAARRGRPPPPAAEERDQVAAFHSITPSARTKNVSEIARPSVLAVLTLTMSSNFVGCSIGRSAGLAPLRMRSTKYAAR